MRQPTTSRPTVRYVVDWRRLPETIALLAAVALWLAFLLRGG